MGPEDGADVGLSYDPAMVSVTGVAPGALATGWSMPSNCRVPGLARVALAGANPITTGAGLLQFSFQALGALCNETALTLARDDLDEGTIPAALGNGSIAICHPADCDCNGLVDLVDVQLVAGRWLCERGEACYDARCDMDGDGAITVLDIMGVVTDWEWSCP